MDNKLKGKTNEAVGTVRRRAGAATGDRSMEAKGAAQQLKGKAQGAMGSAAAKAKAAGEKAKSGARR